jgi:hypothetical protein
MHGKYCEECNEGFHGVECLDNCDVDCLKCNRKNGRCIKYKEEIYSTSVDITLSQSTTTFIIPFSTNIKNTSQAPRISAIDENNCNSTRYKVKHSNKTFLIETSSNLADYYICSVDYEFNLCQRIFQTLSMEMFSKHEIINQSPMINNICITRDLKNISLDINSFVKSYQFSNDLTKLKLKLNEEYSFQLLNNSNFNIDYIHLLLVKENTSDLVLGSLNKSNIISIASFNSSLNSEIIFELSNNKTLGNSKEMMSFYSFLKNFTDKKSFFSLNQTIISLNALIELNFPKNNNTKIILILKNAIEIHLKCPIGFWNLGNNCRTPCGNCLNVECEPINGKCVQIKCTYDLIKPPFCNSCMLNSSNYPRCTYDHENYEEYNRENLLFMWTASFVCIFLVTFIFKISFERSSIDDELDDDQLSDNDEFEFNLVLPSKNNQKV